MSSAKFVSDNCLGIENPSLSNRIKFLTWSDVLENLNHCGFAMITALLTPEECQQVTQLYCNDKLFRSRIIMQRHRFGHGEYKYFSYPLPKIIQTLRENIYPQLVPLANQWKSTLGIKAAFPAQLHNYLDICSQCCQTRPTPLMLKYEAGDFNCLHQDIYGELSFPFQVAIILSEPGQDFSGGEFVLSEQKPRSQSRVHVLNLHQGDAVIFTVRYRPVQGKRGMYRVNLKHGVSSVNSGKRYCLGIIFHDAA
jgi:uncharacterized protein